jgi:hypothetical protein
MNHKYVTKMLDWMVKISSLFVTAPATWIVATALFQDVQSPVLLFIMRCAAVTLVEGVLLSNWLLLEFDKQATPEIKARYGITALAMYVALLVIAWEHEGPVGLVFRIALLAALIGSGWDTYVYTWQKATARTDRDIYSSWQVRRHHRKLAIADAKDSTRMQFELIKRQRDANYDVNYKTLGLETIRQLKDLEQSYQLEAPATKMLLAENDTPSVGTKPRPKMSGKQAREKLADIVAISPDISNRDLSKIVEHSPEWVKAERKRLEISPNGHR